MQLDRETSLTYLGHATILVVTPGGRRLLIDPWLAGNPSCPPEWKSPDRLGKLDAVLLTHIHSDHAGDAVPVLQANPDAAVVATFEACNWLTAKGVRSTKPMNKGGSQEVAGISVTMTHALHSSSFQEQDGTIIYGGEPAGFVLTLENGFTIYAAGDTALFGDMALIREIYHPDLALLPIGDLYTMGPREAAHAVRLLGSKHVVPIHYGTFPALTGTPDVFRAYLSDLPDTEIHVLSPGDTLS